MRKYFGLLLFLIASSALASLAVRLNGTVKEVRYHDSSAITINAVTGAWVELAGGPAFSNFTDGVHVTSTIGEPLAIGVGPSAGAAATTFVINRGEGPLVIGDTFNPGDRVWVRSTTLNSVTSGELVMNFGAE